jgi:hypothetical protein
VPAECVDLAAVYGNTLTRGEYLQLLARGITSTTAVRTISEEDLQALLGEARARLVRDIANSQPTADNE